MKRFIIGLSVGLLITVISCNVVWAQATAQISGSVRDQSGAVLPGVEITATQIETGVARNAVSNEAGSFELPNLLTGPYRLEISLPGFRTYVQTGIVLQVNSNPVINAVLEVGQVSESVEVQANAAMVETRSTGVGQVIENEQILELPLNGRNVTDLVVLAGAAVQTGTANSQSMQGGVRISVAGGLSFGVSYALDGAMHNNPYDGANLPLPFPDALQEFRVEASGSSASNQMKSGGAVNAVTKSGTNEFHGNGFWFVRNYLFNARDYFAAARDSLKRNQLGGTIGGPIIQNKLFFFGGFQRTTTRTDPSSTIRFVPTEAMLSGDFTTAASAVCNSSGQVNLRTPFTGNRVDPAQFSKPSLFIAGRLPKAQDECGKITYGLVEKPNELQAVGKVDYQLSDRHSVFGRYMATTYKLPPPLSFTDNILASTNAGFDNLAQSYAVGDTYLLSPNTVNAYRVTVNRTAIHRVHTPFFSAMDTGVKGYSFLPDHMVLTMTGGGFNLGGNTQNEATFRTTSYQMADDLSLVRGNHQLAFGTNLAHWRVNQYASNQATGGYNFSTQATGLVLADFLLGRLNSLGQGSPTKWATRQWYVGLYSQDSWRATPRLTLNAGLRWEPFLPLSLTQGAVYAFDYDRFQKGIKSTVIPNAPVGFYYPGDEGFPEGAAIIEKWWNFGPRAGFAYDVHGDGRMSVRGAYGFAYDFAVGANLGNSASAPPHAFRTDIQTPASGFEDPWRDFPGGIPFPWEFKKESARFLPFAEFLPTAERDMTPPAIQSWNLSIQRQVPGNMLVSMSYLGSHTTHLWIQKTLNPPIFFPGNTVNGVCTAQGYIFRPPTGTTCSTTANTQQRRKLYLENPQDGQYIGILDAHEDGASSNYNGLLLSVQNRSNRYVTLSGNYTWSHCIGDNTSLGGNATTNSTYLDLNNRSFDSGNCTGDRRHNLNLTAVGETPAFANPTVRALATGWRLSGIYRKSSGDYLTISTGVDRALSGNAGNQRPVQVLENPYGDKDSLNNYLNPAAFVQPELGTFGNMGRANVLAPGTWQFDAALSRIFQFAEAQRIEFRAEAFNVTNSMRRGNPTSSRNSNTFGQINSSREARVMQFALKYVF